MRKSLVIAAVVTCVWAFPAASGYAQGTPATTSGSGTVSDTRWDGPYVSGTLGLWPRAFDIGSSSETIQQVSGVTVQGRGVVVVPATATVLPATNPSATTLLAGVYGGYGRQFERWVGAVEAGFDLGTGSVSNTSAVTLPATLLTPAAPVTLMRSASANIGWSIRARAGYLWNDYVFHGTAGFAGARVKLEATDTWSSPGGPGAAESFTVNLGALGPYITTATETHHKIGLTFGFGAEKSMTDTLSIGAEYRHTGFGTETYAFATPSIAIKGPLPATGSNAQALPGSTTVGFSDNRLAVRVSMKLNFER